MSKEGALFCSYDGTYCSVTMMKYRGCSYLTGGGVSKVFLFLIKVSFSLSSVVYRRTEVLDRTKIVFNADCWG